MISQCKSIIHKRIEDIAHQKWYIDLSNSSMCITYKLFKIQLHFEKHLLNSNCIDIINLTKLRCSNSKLPIHNTIYLYDTQKCTLCNLDTLGDEYHYVLICPFFKQIREQYLRAYYYIRPSYVKLEQLFCSSNNTVLLKLAKFSTFIFKVILILILILILTSICICIFFNYYYYHYSFQTTYIFI